MKKIYQNGFLTISSQELCHFDGFLKEIGRFFENRSVIAVTTRVFNNLGVVPNVVEITIPPPRAVYATAVIQN